MIRLAIFDLDGTLLDTLGDLTDSLNATLASFGFPTRPPEDHRRAIGDGLRRYVSRCLPEEVSGDETLVDEATARMKERYASHWDVRTRPYDGVPELLGALASDGVRLAVLTNKVDELAQRMIARWFGAYGVRPVYGERPERPRKPDPTSALEIMALHDVKPEETAMVGDSRFDMATARNAGAHGVGALWGYGSAEELEKNGAEILAKSPADVIQYCRTH